MKKTFLLGIFLVFVIGLVTALSLSERVSNYEQAVSRYESAVDSLANRVASTIKANKKLSSSRDFVPVDNLRKQAEQAERNVTIAWEDTKGYGAYRDEKELDPYNRRIEEIQRRKSQADRKFTNAITTLGPDRIEP
jgi:hypothetical protein